MGEGSLNSVDIRDGFGDFPNSDEVLVIRGANASLLPCFDRLLSELWK
jgi:hypothetical protein